MSSTAVPGLPIPRITRASSKGGSRTSVRGPAREGGFLGDFGRRTKQGSGERKSPGGVQGRSPDGIEGKSPGRGSGGRSSPEADTLLKIINYISVDL